MNNFPTELLAGYRDFRNGRYAAESQRYHELAERGQRPQTLVIACCDSRTAPEIVFNCAPGEIFVIRNIANLIPPWQPDPHFHGTSAALEFAVQALKVAHIVILGHGRCGGIQAALDPNAEPLSPGDFIGRWMHLLKPAAERIADANGLTRGERQTALERISIRHSIANLRTFPWIKALEDAGKLELHGAWFDISAGELWVMDPETGDFGRPDA
ncbi:MAG TPA: carbonic anhydrase [Pararhizobium sp.]|jgi:carbonic anhydrase|nr:carbonic anhydrase [Pararhizobium sp.]